MANLAARVLPATSRELLERVKRLERTLAFLRSSQDTIGRATVDASKGLIIKGLLRVVGSLDLTGTMSMKSDEGNELVRMGAQEFGRGLTFQRSAGPLAFAFRKVFANSDLESWEWRDRTGQTVVAENSLGPGLGRPYLEHPFEPVAAAPGSAVTCGPFGWERPCSSTDWTTLFVYDGKVQNAFLDFKFASICSDGTTAGEIRVVDLVTGQPLLGFLAAAPWVGPVTASTPAAPGMQIIDPSPEQVVTPIDLGVGAQIRLGVQARRTAGAGTVTVSVAQAIGG